MTGKKESHGLMYIFETGASWKGAIHNADLYVHFKDGLTTEEILGIRPCNGVNLIEKDDVLYFHRSEWEPGRGENFYLIYQSRKNKYYSFKEAVQDRKQLFLIARESSKKEFDTLHKSDFNCTDILSIETYSPLGEIVTHMITAGVIILCAALFFIINNLKKKRK